MIVNTEEIFFIPYQEDNSRSILYAPLRGKLLLVSKKTYENIKIGNLLFFKKSILPILQKNKLIKVENIMNMLRNISPQLAIAITDKCNLKCLYCHADANSPQKNRTIEWSLLRKIIDLYFSTQLKENEKELSVSFAGGGEPTLEPILMAKTIEYINKLAKRVRIKYSMPTNGYFNDEIARYIENNFSDISISLDGPQFIQLKQRPPVKQDKNYFKTVMENAKYLSASKKINVGYRATISDYSLNHLEEILDFFIKEFPGCTLGLEPLNPMGRGRNCKIIELPNKLEFARALGKAIDYVGDKIYIENASTGKIDTIRIYFCMAIATVSWNITPDGKLWCCTRDNAPEFFCYGKFDEKKNKMIFDEEKIRKIRNTNVLNFKECQECFMKYNCAGDCPDLRATNLVNCHSNRTLGAKYFSQIISKKGGYYERYKKEREGRRKNI